MLKFINIIKYLEMFLNIFIILACLYLFITICFSYKLLHSRYLGWFPRNTIYCSLLFNGILVDYFQERDLDLRGPIQHMLDSGLR